MCDFCFEIGFGVIYGLLVAFIFYILATILYLVYLLVISKSFIMLRLNYVFVFRFRVRIPI